MDTKDIYLKTLQALDVLSLPTDTISVHIIIDNVGCIVLCKGIPITTMQKIAKAVHDVIEDDIYEIDNMAALADN